MMVVFRKLGVDAAREEASLFKDSNALPVWEKVLKRDHKHFLFQSNLPGNHVGLELAEELQI